MEEKLSIQDLISLLIDKHSMSQENAEQFVVAFFDLIKEELQNEGAVKVKGLGVFKKIAVESRDSISVNSGERIQIEGYNKIVFTPEASVRDLVNKPFSHFESVVLKDSTVFDDMSEAEIEELATDVLEEEETEFPETGNEPEDLSEPEHLSEPENHPEPENISEQKDLPEPAHSQEGPVLQAETAVENIHSQELSAEKQTTSVPVADTKDDESPCETTAEQDKPDTPSKHSGRGNWVLSLFIFVLIIVGLCIGFICYLYSDAFYTEDLNESTTPTQETAILPDSITVLQDTASLTVPMTTTDTVERPIAAPMVPQQETRPKVSEKKPARNYSESKSYKISGTKAVHTLKSGNTLMKLSLKYYGTKAFWFYIVQYNKDVITDPDNVPIGTILKIPELVEK